MKRLCPVSTRPPAPRSEIQFVREPLGINLVDDDPDVDDCTQDELPTVYPSVFDHATTTKRLRPSLDSLKNSYLTPSVFDEYAAANSDHVQNGALHHEKLTKGKQKIPIEFIQDRARRYSTFSKRKTGMMKKAVELAELTGAEVLLLIASETNHVYTYATKRLRGIIDLDCGKELIKTCLSSDSSPKELEDAPIEVGPAEPIASELSQTVSTGSEVNSQNDVVNMELLLQDLVTTQMNVAANQSIPITAPNATTVDRESRIVTAADTLVTNTSNTIPYSHIPISNIQNHDSTAPLLGPNNEDSTDCLDNQCSSNVQECQPKMNLLYSMLTTPNSGLNQLVLLPQTLSNSLMAVQNLNSILCSPLPFPLQSNFTASDLTIPTHPHSVVVTSPQTTVNKLPVSSPLTECSPPNTRLQEHAQPSTTIPPSNIFLAPKR